MDGDASFDIVAVGGTILVSDFEGDVVDVVVDDGGEVKVGFP